MTAVIVEFFVIGAGMFLLLVGWLYRKGMGRASQAKVFFTQNRAVTALSYKVEQSASKCREAAREYIKSRKEDLLHDMRMEDLLEQAKKQQIWQ